MTTFDVDEAIDRLFDEIVSQSGNPALIKSLALIRSETQRYRQYEDVLLPDREAEYVRLLDCWLRRDKIGLQKELVLYFQRREDIAGKVAGLINCPN